MKHELNYIKNPAIKQTGEILVEMLPEYFFEVAASSTGKYHPKFSLGKGGLLRHTKAAVRLAYDLLELDFYAKVYTQDEKDIMILALILHDALKHGHDKSEYVLFDHPMIVSNFISQNRDKLPIDDINLKVLKECIESHMGQWNKDYKTGIEKMPLPQSKMQKFVHQCDYLAARRYLNIEFDEDNEIIENF